MMYNELNHPLSYTPFKDFRWTIKEEQRLFNSYESLNEEKAKLLFPDRTWDTVKKKARSLGLFQVLQWTEEEINILKQGTFKPFEELTKQLPLRTIDAIETKFYRLGLHKGGMN